MVYGLCLTHYTVILIRQFAGLQFGSGYFLNPLFYYRNMESEKIYSINQKVSSLVEPILLSLGFELVDVEYLSANSRWVLRLFIDKEGGVTIDDCAQVSREIGDLIDIKDIIDHKYVLEVSSPGLNRPLKKDKDFIRAIDKKIKVKLSEPVNNCSNFSGYLKDFKDGTLILEVEEEEAVLPRSKVYKANLVYEFK